MAYDKNDAADLQNKAGDLQNDARTCAGTRTPEAQDRSPRVRGHGAQHWVVRGPDPWLIYGPFNSIHDAVAYGQKTWPDFPQIQYDSGDSKGWEVEPLYPPEVK